MALVCTDHDGRDLGVMVAMVQGRHRTGSLRRVRRQARDNRSVQKPWGSPGGPRTPGPPLASLPPRHRLSGAVHRAYDGSVPGACCPRFPVAVSNRPRSSTGGAGTGSRFRRFAQKINDLRPTAYHLMAFVTLDGTSDIQAGLLRESPATNSPLRRTARSSAAPPIGTVDCMLFAAVPFSGATAGSNPHGEVMREQERTRT